MLEPAQIFASIGVLFFAETSAVFECFCYNRFVLLEPASFFGTTGFLICWNHRLDFASLLPPRRLDAGIHTILLPPIPENLLPW